MGSTSIAWLRNDLRIADNPALSAAVRAGDQVVALYIHETTHGVRRPGAAARWWLHQSLEALGADLAERGIRLAVREGDAHRLLPEAVKEYEAGSVYWNRRYAPAECEADASIKATLKANGVDVHSCPGNVLVEPWDIATGQGKPYSVFTPFWKTLRDKPIAAPMRRPDAREAVRLLKVDTDYRAPK
jgi:deoxyribodipyrimidine photo-lyase